eukprot:TRINITY_DN878_c0_g1_i2.p1 TRINITY_DN878_c0_g1~~TRINITY_DN878_c0_g1_i2.p1  ORF type:complete len:1588 (+),score=410.80 TRINITY_DN878_c0_g1_i2:68-4831(+)
MADPITSPARYLKAVLDKLVDLSSRKHKELREAAAKAIDELKAIDAKPSEFSGGKYFPVIKLACDCKVTKMTDVALGAVQKLLEIGALHPGNTDMLKVIETICNCFDQQEPSNAIELQIIKCCITAVKSPKCEVHDSGLLLVVRTCYNIHLVSRDPVNQESAKGTLTQILHYVFNKIVLPPSSLSPVAVTATPPTPAAAPAATAETALDGKAAEAAAAEAKPASDSVPEETAAAAPPEDIAQKDAFMIFRALCKLSMKALPEGATADSIELCSKVLALELLHSIVKDKAAVLQSSDKFIGIVKQSLFMSILRNGTSTTPSVLSLSMNIFQTLLVTHKFHLKAEIGVFLTSMLTLLETPNSTFQQKWMVLQVLDSLYQDAQFMVDIFLNYDCDLQGLDIFERAANDLSKLTQGKHTADNWVSTAQAESMRLFALEVLVRIVRSMETWLDKTLASEAEAQGAHAAAAALATPTVAAVVDDSTAADAVEEPTQEKGDEPAALQMTPALAAQIVDGTASSPEDFERRKHVKAVLDQGVLLFNRKPKKGIEFLVRKGFIDGDAKSIAAFLRKYEGLNKTIIGEYIGELADLNIAVLHEIIFSLDFATSEFDDALRLMCQQFRLPGEAQKIDRIMLHFAQHYCETNPGKFSSADTAYVLAYSMMMLHTDAHSPNVKNKMSKAAWLANNQGIDNDKDLPKEYLEDLYDRIIRKEIKLRDDELVLVKAASGVTPKRKQELWSQERMYLIKKSQQVLREKGADAVFYSGTRSDHIRPMLEAVWAPILGALSVYLDQTDEEKAVTVCLQGFKSAIHVACNFLMDTERSAFVSALQKLSLLDGNREMKPKNIECTKLITQIALNEGNNLQSSWFIVLQCISQIERLLVIASGVTDVDVLMTAADRSQQRADNEGLPAGRPGSVSISSVDLNNAYKVATAVDEVTLERIFSKSARLTGDAIVDFVTHLCRVSLAEIHQPSPRIFCMQKIVEVTEQNMIRIRVVWNHIWNILAKYFNTVGSLDNLPVAQYAIDSLRQLAMKFLEKEELANYQFQKEFLKPFDFVFTHHPSTDIKWQVVRCMYQMVLVRAANIKSGWRPLLRVFCMAAQDTTDSVVQLGFEAVTTIITKNFKCIVDNLTFVEFVNCVSAYATNHVSQAVAIKALSFLGTCAEHLAEHDSCAVALKEGPYLYTDSDAHMRVWFPILTGLQPVISDRRLEVRTEARKLLLDILKRYGGIFSAGLWRLMFSGVVLPIFQHVRHGHNTLTKEDEEWLETTCFGCMYGIAELFPHYFPAMSGLVADMMKLLIDCMKQPCEALSRMAVTCTTHLVCSTGEMFTSQHWNNVTDSIADVFQATTPSELLTLAPTSTVSSEMNQFAATEVDIIEATSTKGPLSDARRKSIVQQLLVQAVADIVSSLYDKMGRKDLQTILDCLEGSSVFARTFNACIDVRIGLVRAGFVTQPPTLRNLETESMLAYLGLLFRMYASTSDTRAQAEARLTTLIVNLLQEHVKEGIVPPTLYAQHHATAQIRVIQALMRGVCKLERDQFERLLPQVYEFFVQLVRSPIAEVCAELVGVFSRVGTHFGLYRAQSQGETEQEGTE